MYSLDLPADVIASIRDRARDADISAARTFGFGGSNWDVERPIGVGMGVRTLTDAGSIHALAWRQRPGSLTAAAGSTPVLDDTWRLIVLDDTGAMSGTLLPGDVITSAADSDYVFGIASLEPWYEYRRAELERKR